VTASNRLVDWTCFDQNIPEQMRSLLLNNITGDSKPRAATAHTNTVTIKATATKGKAHSTQIVHCLKPAVAAALASARSPNTLTH
jgi:hypothetical protein